MTSMLKVKVRWSGFTGAPGFTNFFFSEGASGTVDQAQADAAVAKVQTFFTAIASGFTPNLTLQVQSDVEAIEPTTGQMASIFTVTPPAPIVGSNVVLTFSGPTGMVVNWQTAGVRNGRRVRGRTFLVPMSTAVYQNDGTIEPTRRTQVLTAALAMVGTSGTPDLGVWARPTAPGATDGVWHAATSSTVPDLAAVLRSRRD